MPQQQEANCDYVFVRNRQTKRIDIRRANQLSPRRGAYPKTQDHSLHYIGPSREQICRCSTPTRHGEQVFSVASESIHLNASLALYMTRHNVESCTAKEFQKYSRGRETEWAKEGVFVNSFHYGTREKNVVCRCTQPDDHTYGGPRNPEIIEQCAEYFCLHKDRITVSKKEWRRVDGDTPPLYGSGAPDQSQNPKGPNIELFHGSDDETPTNSIPKREMKMRSKAVLLNPSFVTSQQNGAARQQEPEMPSLVWQNARPSLWAQRGGMSSTVTTPLGSPSSPLGPSCGPASAPLANHHPASTTARPDSVYTSWSQVQRDADVRDMRWGMKTAPIGKCVRPGSDPFRYSCYLSMGEHGKEALGNRPDALTAATETDEHVEYRPSVGEQYLQPPRVDGYRLQPVVYNPCLEKSLHKEAVQIEMTPNAPVAELPAHAPTAQLPGDIPRRQHTPTLERLEGRDSEAISRRESTAKTTMEQPDTMSNRMSCLTQNSDLFNSLLEQIQSSPVSSTTDCETQSITMMSPLRVAESGRDYQEHEEPSEDTKPTPESMETLADRINAQREAIFGSQMTPLQEELQIEFPQRSDVVVCTSQEDVSVAQLLLINGHVYTHAIEAIHLFETMGIEPDWHKDVVQPAVELFRGWNRPFADLISYLHKAFLNLMAWAKLLCLMGDAQEALGHTQGGDVRCAWVEELQDRFIEAKELYDNGKEKWRIDIFEPLSCDKVASYVVARAMETIAS